MKKYNLKNLNDVVELLENNEYVVREIKQSQGHYCWVVRTPNDMKDVVYGSFSEMQAFAKLIRNANNYGRSL